MKKKINWGLLAALLLSVILLSAGCSSTKKFKSSEKLSLDISTGSSRDSMAVSKSDSTGTRADESASLIKKDSSHVRTDESSAEETISVTLRKDTAGGKPANDYTGAPVIHDVVIDGHNIHSSQGIENVTIKNKSGTRTIDAHQLQAIDSSGSRSTQTAQVNKFDSGHTSARDTAHSELDFQSKSKEVKRTGLGIGSYLIIAGGLVFLFFAWRWGWLRRKKRKEDPEDKNSNPLTSVPYQPPPPPAAEKT